MAALVFSKRAPQVGSVMANYRKNNCIGQVIDLKKGVAYQLKLDESEGVAIEVAFVNKLTTKVNT